MSLATLSSFRMPELSRPVTALPSPCLPHSSGGQLPVALPTRTQRRSASHPPRGGRFILGPSFAGSESACVHLGLEEGPVCSRAVVIKRLNASLRSDPASAWRFRQAARLHARVADEHVVRLLDVVTAEDEPWLVMEHQEGISLEALLTRAQDGAEPLPPDIAVGIMVSVLQGLHAAHEVTDGSGRLLGLVHLDVTSQNILVGVSGVAKLTNFGRADVENGPCLSPRVRTGPGLLAPEQVQGAAVDRRADVFAAGVLLWELLTGRSLFRAAGAPNATVLRNILGQAIPLPSSIREGIPSALDRAVLRALQRDQASRFGSALEFAAALDAAQPSASSLKIGALVRLRGASQLAWQRRARDFLAAKISEEEESTVVSLLPRSQDDDEVTLLAYEAPATPSTAPLVLTPPTAPIVSTAPSTAPAPVASTAPLVPATRVASPSAAASVRGRAPTRSLRRSTLWGCLAAIGSLFLIVGTWRPLSRGISAKLSAHTPTVHALPPVAPPAGPAVGGDALPVDDGGAAPPAPASQSPVEPASVAPPLRPARLPRLSSWEGQRVAAQPPLPPMARSCAEPTYQGSDGILHFKEHCL